MAAPLRRRRLARTPQELRERTDLNVTEAAKLAGFSQAKLSRIETAQIAISGDDTFALCEVLGVAEDVTDALVTLARQAKRRDWWKTYPNTVLGRTTDLLELEADADSVHYFTLDAIPGLLQTESYAAAVMQHGFPRESADELEQRVAVRMARQQHVESARAAWRKAKRLAATTPVSR
jgi:transcriptional regulator with XRE-family HTH domain